MREKIKVFTYKLEASFILTVIKHGLAMMIPFVLTGGIASALVNFPFEAYQNIIRGSFFEKILNTVYTGTFGLFSIAMLVSLCASFCMECNMTVDKTVMYILVGVAAYGAQLYVPDAPYNYDMFGVKGCFFAITTALISCHLLNTFYKIKILNLRKYTFGLERITAVAITMFLPAICVICIIVISTHLILWFFGAVSLYELISNFMCIIFDNIHNQFMQGFIYTILVHVLWMFGLHGSHILEPIVTTSFNLGQAGEIFSKSFYDVYVSMGGCGTSVCVLLALLIFFRKSRMNNIAKISIFTVPFNLNEMLTFGIPIILNPIMFVPFLVTPIFCYVTAYVATMTGLVPPVIHGVTWSTPIIFSGYLATGSINGSILQVVMVAVGVSIYLPFLKINMTAQEKTAKEQMSEIVKLLQEKEELNENVDLLFQSNRIGQIARMLRHDLRSAIERDELYILYQPQVDCNDVCLGAEALLRWNHPLYGFIYPPLIIYLAKEGGILEPLEKKIIDKTVAAIDKVNKECGSDFKISINLTSKSLLWDIEEYIDETLAKYNIQPSQLWIEITEQDVLSKATTVINKIERLKEKGHVMMIDDFGMGHTSILYLQSSQFGVVKLDGSLVKDVLENTTNQQIISSIVSLAEKLNVKIISEYVETEKQRDKLLELGCKWYQGYLYEKPIPLLDFIEFMKLHPSK